MTFNIVYVHLLNDFSGSPKVLSAAIKAVTTTTDKTRLYVGSQGNGILSECGIPVTRYWYRRTGQRVLTLFTYLFSQCVLLVKLLCDRSIDKNAVIYVNTLLPFGAALYGKLTGRKVLYHVHEISITPASLKILLTTIARMTSSLNLYVSDAHMQAMPISGVPARRVYNALDASFIESASSSNYTHRHDGCFNILMIASLRDYKGVPELLGLAAGFLSHPDICFHLVVNDEEVAITRYFTDKTLPANLTVHPRTDAPAAFYKQANLVLNLSRVNQWLETFGLTILEAMAFGIPVIVPPVGGPAELVEEDVQGYLVNSYDLEKLKERVLLLYNNEQLCNEMSANGRKRAADFSPEVFANNIREVISGL